MCTLTFIPIENDGFILTSNRDEAPGRNTIEPKRYQEGGTELLFPKDELAGGTWIGVSDKKRLVYFRENVILVSMTINMKRSRT